MTTNGKKCKIMKLKLERFMNRTDCCIGILSYEEGGMISHVVEPSYLKGQSEEIGAVPEGVYDIYIVVNPISGTPCIRLDSRTQNLSVSLRCNRPMSRRNRSPYLANISLKPIMSIEANMKGWAKLISMLMEEEENEVEILPPRGRTSEE